MELPVAARRAAWRGRQNVSSRRAFAEPAGQGNKRCQGLDRGYILGLQAFLTLGDGKLNFLTL